MVSVSVPRVTATKSGATGSSFATGAGALPPTPHAITAIALSVATPNMVGPTPLRRCREVGVRSSWLITRPVALRWEPAWRPEQRDTGLRSHR